ncbi:hypothetical protein CEXT_161061 [Caerostris extrusa]|uniref:Uncharacterized protein n=1 Tax=Caerostris extrusa TaxID=172846 RepID=A0AAV4W6Q0_CAEEX|nr:hypothetical protein CEXT_161061 [Caerostris extrusa]
MMQACGEYHQNFQSKSTTTLCKSGRIPKRYRLRILNMLLVEVDDNYQVYPPETYSPGLVLDIDLDTNTCSSEFPDLGKI